MKINKPKKVLKNCTENYKMQEYKRNIKVHIRKYLE